MGRPQKDLRAVPYGRPRVVHSLRRRACLFGEHEVIRRSRLFVAVARPGVLVLLAMVCATGLAASGHGNDVRLLFRALLVVLAFLVFSVAVNSTWWPRGPSGTSSSPRPAPSSAAPCCAPRTAMWCSRPRWPPWSWVSSGVWHAPAQVHSPVGPRARGAATRRQRARLPPDRCRALHSGEDGGEPRAQHLGQIAPFPPPGARPVRPRTRDRTTSFRSGAPGPVARGRRRLRRLSRGRTMG